MIAGADAEDEFGGNNAASVFGSATTIHDIALTDYYLSPVVNDEQKMRMKVRIWMVLATEYGFVGGDITSPLSPENMFGGRSYPCLILCITDL